MQEKELPIQSQPSLGSDDATFSFDLDKEADAIEHAVSKVLKDGYRTIDIMSEGKTQVGTEKMGDLIAENI